MPCCGSRAAPSCPVKISLLYSRTHASYRDGSRRGQRHACRVRQHHAGINGHGSCCPLHQAPPADCCHLSFRSNMRLRNTCGWSLWPWWLTQFAGVGLHVIWTRPPAWRYYCSNGCRHRDVKCWNFELVLGEGSFLQLRQVM